MKSFENEFMDDGNDMVYWGVLLEMRGKFGTCGLSGFGWYVWNFFWLAISFNNLEKLQHLLKNQKNSHLKKESSYCKLIENSLSSRNITKDDPGNYESAKCFHYKEAQFST